MERGRRVVPDPGTRSGCGLAVRSGPPDPPHARDREIRAVHVPVLGQPRLCAAWDSVATEPPRSCCCRISRDALRPPLAEHRNPGRAWYSCHGCSWASSTNLLPPAIARVQIVSYTRQDRGEALRLAKSMMALPPAPPLPNPLPAAPQVPMSYLGHLTERSKRFRRSATTSRRRYSSIFEGACSTPKRRRTSGSYWQD